LILNLAIQHQLIVRSAFLQFVGSSPCKFCGGKFCFSAQLGGRNALWFFWIRKRIFETFRQSIPKEDRQHHHIFAIFAAFETFSRML
jgi:hypothetical protein